MDKNKEQDVEENSDLISLQAPIRDFGTIKKFPDEPARLFDLPFPVDIPFEDSYHEYFQGETFKPAYPTGHEEIGRLESLKQGFESVNEFSLLYNSQTNHENPLYDHAPPGWKPSDDEDAFNGIDEIYQGHLLAATSPKDLKRRQYQAIDWMDKEKRYNDGSMLYHAIGIGGGIISSPSTWIPLGAEIKAANLGKRLVQDIPSVFPGIAAGSAVHEYFVETNKINGSIQEFITNSFRDTVMGLAFMGGAMGLSHSYTGGKLWNAKRIVNEANKDIELKPVLDEEGSMIGIKAFSNSASAKEVEFAQNFANSTMAQKGLFAVPIIGGYIGKGAATFNPIIRMLNSPFESVRSFIDRAADHGIVTLGNLAGYASPDKFEVKMGLLAGDNKKFMYWLKGLHLERNGLDPSKRVSSAFKETKMRWQENGYVSPEKFMDEIENVIINEVQSVHATVNEAAEAMRSKMDESWKAFREAYNLPEDFMPPKTARGYLSRVYDLDYLKTNENKWNEVVVNWLKESDATIATRMQPIKQLEQQHKIAKENHLNYIQNKSLTSTEIKKSADNVLNLKRQLKAQQELLQNELRQNEALRIHVDDHFALSADEAKQLKKLLAPLDKLKKESKTTKKELDDLKLKILRNKENASKAKTQETVAKYNKEVLKLEKELPKVEEKYREFQKSIDIENLRLQDLAANKEISSLFYNRIPGSSAVKFKNPKQRLKFRNLYESEFHMQQASSAYYRSIMNQKAEDTIAQVMNTITTPIGSNPTMQRSLMLPDHLMYQSNFLSKNLGVNVANYRNFLGRRTFIKNLYKDVSIEGGVAPLAEALNKEFMGMKEILNAKKQKLESKKNPTKKDTDEIKNIDKQLLTLQKQFKSATEDMNHAYNKMMGITQGSESIRKYTNIVRNFAVSTKLGAVPLTMITDLMGIVFKHGFWPFVRDGLIPSIKNMSNLIKQGKGENYVSNAGHANMGLNHVLSGYADRYWGTSAQPYTPLSGALANGMEKMAHLSGNISGMNQIENFFQEVTASTIQSKIIGYMHDFKAGVLKPRDKEKLLVYGLQPEEWADRMIDAWKKAGSDKNGLGGYQSWYWKWADHEASAKMAETVYRGTKDTIIRRGMFDAPFALDDPIMGMLFMFKGYVAASLTRYLVPLMQRPDAEKLIGTILMMGAGSLVTPLRRVVKGEEAFQEDDNMFWNAMVDGNVFSPIADTVEHVNVLLGGTLLQDIKNDRYKNRTIAGLVAGPAGGIADDMVHILKMMASGNLNQTDVNKMVRLIPFTQSWQFRGLSNKMVESLGLPETFSDAQAMNYQ